MINNQLINKKSVNLSKPGKHILYNTAIISLLKQFNKLPKDLIILNLELDDFILENENKNLEDVYYLKYYYHKKEYIRKGIRIGVYGAVGTGAATGAYNLITK